MATEPLAVQLLSTAAIGVALSGSPCAIPLYPGFLAYLGKRVTRFSGKRSEALLGLTVLGGVLTSMLVLAAASTGLRLSIGAVLVQTAPVVNSLLIVFGILLILNVNIWNRLPAFAAPRLRNPVAESYGFGLLYGPIVLPCNAPLVLSVIALSTTLPDFFSVFAVYVVFGLGLGLPLLLLSVLTRAGQQWLVHQFTRHHRLVNVLAGAILVGIGVYDFVITFRFLSLFLP